MCAANIKSILSEQLILAVLWAVFSLSNKLFVVK